MSHLSYLDSLGLTACLLTCVCCLLAIDIVFSLNSYTMGVGEVIFVYVYCGS